MKPGGSGPAYLVAGFQVGALLYRGRLSVVLSSLLSLRRICRGSSLKVVALGRWLAESKVAYSLDIHVEPVKG